MKKLDEMEASKLWEILKEKDEFTAQHCKRVQGLASQFASSIGWNADDIRWLKIGALLHDLGKLDVPDEIYDKIRKGNSLSQEERELVKQHTGHSRHLDEYENIPNIIDNILKYHHERYNGTGYPFGLAGEDIPVEVQILTIADYYDTIINQRSYKVPETMKPLNHHDSIKILIDESVTRFSPRLVEKFIRNVILANDKPDK